MPAKADPKDTEFVEDLLEVFAGVNGNRRLASLLESIAIAKTKAHAILYSFRRQVPARFDRDAIALSVSCLRMIFRKRRFTLADHALGSRAQSQLFTSLILTLKIQ
ncbi:MAG: hypothetical protein JO283_18050 [Bradyrhizobium sp.]|nr:hypothetical protein [Bradyrhizobium sp.]